MRENMQYSSFRGGPILPSNGYLVQWFFSCLMKSKTVCGNAEEGWEGERQVSIVKTHVIFVGHIFRKLIVMYS